jgi:hypothetical protein
MENVENVADQQQQQQQRDPLLNARDRLYHTLFFRLALAYARYLTSTVSSVSSLESSMFMFSLFHLNPRAHDIHINVHGYSDVNKYPWLLHITDPKGSICISTC